MGSITVPNLPQVPLIEQLKRWPIKKWNPHTNNNTATINATGNANLITTNQITFVYAATRYDDATGLFSICILPIQAERLQKKIINNSWWLSCVAHIQANTQTCTGTGTHARTHTKKTQQAAENWVSLVFQELLLQVNAILCYLSGTELLSSLANEK